MGSGEEEGLAFGFAGRGGGRAEVSDDGFKGRQETKVQQTVRLIENCYVSDATDNEKDTAQPTQTFDPRTLKPNGTVQMLQQSARRRDQNVHSPQSIPLLFQWFTANDETSRKVVVFPDIPQLVESLHGELPSRRDDDCAEPVHGTPFKQVQSLQKGDEKGERLAGSSLGRSQDVLPAESRWDSESLDSRGREEMGGFQSLQRARRQGELREQGDLRRGNLSMSTDEE